MGRISNTFARLKKEGRKALIPFITAGDPSLAETEKLIFSMEEAGADIIELGVPFSEPMADGPVIQAASERALKKGATLSGILGLVEKVRKKSQIPILLMGYYNPIFIMGHDVFAKKAAKAGVDAVLIVDLPPEEAAPLRSELKKNKIDLVCLLAPTSDDGRIQKAARLATGFIYYVSLTGVTGAQLTMTAEIGDQIRKIRAKTKTPIAVGFGISRPDQAKHLSKQADGIVIGSALVQLIAKQTQKTRQTAVLRFLRAMRQALDS